MASHVSSIIWFFGRDFTISSGTLNWYSREPVTLQFDEFVIVILMVIFSGSSHGLTRF